MVNSVRTEPFQSVHHSGSVLESAITDSTIPNLQKKQDRKTFWLVIRLTILLSISVPLLIFGYYRNIHLTTLSKINHALESGEDRLAIQEIKKLDKTFGLTAESCFLRARAYRHLGDDIAFAQFAELARQLGYSEQKLASEKLLRATQLGDITNIDEALAKAMTSEGAELSEIGPAMTYGLLGQRNFAGVNSILNFWSTQEPDSPWIPLFRSMLSYSSQDIQTALDLIEKNVAKHPAFLPNYRHYGMCLRQAKELEKAAAAFKRHLKSAPDDMEIVSALGNVLVDMDRRDEVVALYQPMIESGKATIDMKLVLGRVYMAQNEPKKVIEILGSSANLWPEDVPIANLMSQANQAAGNDVEAQRFSKIAEAGQADIQSIDGRTVRLMSGQDKAVEKFWELGHILLHKQSRDEGIHWINNALAIDENFLPAHEDMVIYYTRMNLKELAARHQRFINLRRGNP